MRITSAPRARIAASFSAEVNLGRKITQRLPNSLAPAATERPWLPELAVENTNWLVTSLCLPFMTSAKLVLKW